MSRTITIPGIIIKVNCCSLSVAVPDVVNGVTRSRTRPPGVEH